jgi:hypothetical protein
VLAAYTDPQKVPEAFTSRNRLLSCARGGGRDTVPKGQLIDPGNRALEVSEQPLSERRCELFVVKIGKAGRVGALR